MTSEQRALLKKFSAWEYDNGVDFEELLDALSANFAERSKRTGEDQAVAGCFETIAHHLSEASMAFYVSTK